MIGRRLIIVGLCSDISMVLSTYIVHCGKLKFDQPAVNFDYVTGTKILTINNL